MTRLTRDFPSYHRSMQISANSVFVFVEGKKVDPFFYGAISHSVCKDKRIPYVLCKASELSGSGGGKQVLLSYFQYLRRKSFLKDDFKGKKMTTIFYLDKDVDDILRTLRHSPHLVYTAYYDVCNHLFIEGNLSKALAVAASLDPGIVKSRITSNPALRLQLAQRWKDWVKLCLFTTKKKINCQANYGLTSRVNNSPGGLFNQTAYNQLINEMKFKLGLTDQQFSRAFNRVSRFVDQIYANGLQDRVFKGKWYGYLCVEYVRRINTTAHCQGLPDRLPGCISASIDFNAPWADYFKQPLKKLIDNM